jgi:hypothetical protein
MSTTASDSSATITVVPANTTAPPEVAVARAIDSRVLHAGSALRLVAGHDEQRVVDPHAEPDHRRERRRHRRHLGEVADQRDDREPADEAGYRGHDREPHRHDRAEREEQDDDGHREADRLARVRLGL